MTIMRSHISVLLTQKQALLWVSALTLLICSVGAKQSLVKVNTLIWEIKLTFLGIQRLLAMRGIVEPSDEHMREIQKNQKVREQHQYLTFSSNLSGDKFQLNEQELRATAEFVKEMD